MIKRDELTNPKSCMSRAKDDEMTFVLLGRDVAAPWVIRFWAILRVLFGKNRWSDAQIREAFAAARKMAQERRKPKVTVELKGRVCPKCTLALMWPTGGAITGGWGDEPLATHYTCSGCGAEETEFAPGVLVKQHPSEIPATAGDATAQGRAGGGERGTPAAPGLQTSAKAQSKGLGETVESINAAKRVLEEKSERHGANVCTISGNLPDPGYTELGAAPQPVNLATGQHKDYYVLCAEERAKGFVRPVRTTYTHIIPKPTYPTRPLSEEQQRLFGDCGYSAFEPYPEGTHGSSTGRYWTKAQLERKCGVATTMSRPLAETYARDPKFYGSTFCVGCRNHFPIEEFVWDDGSVLGS